MGFGLEGMNQIDNVRMRAQLVVVFEFLGKFVDCKARCIIGGIRLGQALDGNQFIRINIFSQMDHAKGTMVEKLDGFEASINAYAVSLVDKSPTRPRKRHTRQGGLLPGKYSSCTPLRRVVSSEGGGFLFFKDYGIGESTILFGLKSRSSCSYKKNQNSLLGSGGGFDDHAHARGMPPAEVSNLSIEEYRLFKRTDAEI